MVVGLVVEKKLGTLLLHKTTIILRKGREALGGGSH
jgi:hypothetical protein